MTEEANKALARRSFEELWNQGNLAAAPELYDANHISHGLGVDVPPGIEGLTQFITLYRTAYPDTHFTIEDQIAEGDKVVTRWTAIGTHQGELMGIPPTGKRVTVTGMAISRIGGGKLIETWNNFDALGQFQQLGVVPGPASA